MLPKDATKGRAAGPQGGRAAGRQGCVTRANLLAEVICQADAAARQILVDSAPAAFGRSCGSSRSRGTTCTTAPPSTNVSPKRWSRRSRIPVPEPAHIEARKLQSGKLGQELKDLEKSQKDRIRRKSKKLSRLLKPLTMLPPFAMDREAVEAGHTKSAKVSPLSACLRNPPDNTETRGSKRAQAVGEVQGASGANVAVLLSRRQREMVEERNRTMATAARLGSSQRAFSGSFKDARAKTTCMPKISLRLSDSVTQ